MSTAAARGITPKYQRNRRIVMRYATRCEACGLPPTQDDPLTCGHIIPRAWFIANGFDPDAANDLSNMQPQHRSCNYRAREASRQ